MSTNKPYQKNVNHTGMKYIHAVLPNGEVVKGVEVFRRIYEVIGLGWVYAVTKLPLIGSAAGTF